MRLLHVGSRNPACNHGDQDVGYGCNQAQASKTGHNSSTTSLAYTQRLQQFANATVRLLDILSPPPLLLLMLQLAPCAATAAAACTSCCGCAHFAAGRLHLAAEGGYCLAGHQLRAVQPGASIHHQCLTCDEPAADSSTHGCGHGAA